jgi:hypothetical protein
MVKKLEKLLKDGKIKEVQSHLEKIEPSKVARAEALTLAGISRRAGFHRLAFKILNPIVRPKNKLEKIKATPEELVEYGMILFRLGVINESRKVLNSATACPEHELFLAFTYFSEWDYAKAREILESYVSSPGISDYNLLLGKLNLAQAYVGLEDPRKAIPITKEVISKAKSLKLNLLLANALQNLIDAYIECKELKKIEESIQELKNLMGDSHYRYDLYLQETIAVTKLPDVTLLREVGKTARQKRMYEIVRKCDLLEAIATRNEDLFRKVYFGSPYPEYRKKILRQWGKPIDLGDSYLWSLNPDRKSERIFDVAEGCDVGTGKKLKKGTAVHNLLKIFAGNLYVTYKAEALYSYLFPKDNLDFRTSIHKVYDTILRARNWLESEGMGFSIAEAHGEYFLFSEGGYQLKIPVALSAAADLYDAKVKDLKAKVGSAVFTANAVVDILSVSKATATRILKRGIEDGELETFGQGKSTKYRFSAKEDKSVA